MTKQSFYDTSYSPIEGATYASHARGDLEMGHLNSSSYPQDNSMLEFFAELDEIKREIASYDATVDRIDQLHIQALSEVNEEQLELVTNQLSGVMEQSRAQGADVKRRIQQLVNQAQRDSTKKNQAENVKRQFQESVSRYQSVEGSFRKKFRNRAERQFRTIRPDAPEDEVKNVVDEAELGNTQIFANAIRQSSRRGEAQYALDEVQNRHREIVLINQTIEELARLFQDLEIMVAEQDVAVDNIVENTALVNDHMDGGIKEMVKTKETLISIRKKKWICFAIVVVVIIILVAVLASVLHKWWVDQCLVFWYNKWD